MGMALSGWNMYEKGLLSTIIEDSSTLPKWVRSYQTKRVEKGCLREDLCFSSASRGVCRRHLDVVSIMLHTRLPKEPILDHSIFVQDVQQRVSVLDQSETNWESKARDLGQACSEHNNFEFFPYFAQKMIDSWSLSHIPIKRTCS